MKEEKIKRYNQKILAILGTVAVVFLLVALGAFVVTLIREFTWNNQGSVETGILSDERIAELQQENKREQVISYEVPQLIDTSNSVYIIPVSHKTLNEKEDLSEFVELMDASGNFDYELDQRYSNQFYGIYNNLIVYRPESETSTSLFDKRVNFNEINTEYFEDDILLTFQVAEQDTYKDGVINLLDFKSLYIYSMNEKKLRKIGIDGADVFSYKFLNNSKDLVILFGIDKNDDGKYEEFNEPTQLRKYDYQTETLVDIVDEKLKARLQGMLEGTEK